jgi:hypothetical protein
MVEVLEDIEEVVAKKFCEIEKEVASEKGNFNLFALVQREDASFGQWDIVIAAPWIGEEEMASMRIIANKMSAKLTQPEYRIISRIVVLSPTDSFVKKMNKRFDVKHGMLQAASMTINGIPITEAFIITSSSS